MTRLLKKCVKCGLYTLQKTCPRCRSETVYPHPAPFSPDDKYARYRIASRYMETGKGFIDHREE